MTVFIFNICITFAHLQDQEAFHANRYLFTSVVMCRTSLFTISCIATEKCKVSHKNNNFIIHVKKQSLSPIILLMPYFKTMSIIFIHTLEPGLNLNSYVFRISRSPSACFATARMVMAPTATTNVGRHCHLHQRHVMTSMLYVLYTNTTKCFPL